MGVFCQGCPWPRASRLNMVTSVMRALLLQAFLAFHVHATLSAADLKRGHEALKKLLEDEKKVLCGSTQIFDSLKETSTQKARIVQWDFIDRVAKHNLERYDKQMKEITTKIKKKKKKKKVLCVDTNS